MKTIVSRYRAFVERMANRLGLSLRAKLIMIFLLVKVVPLILLAIIAWRQFTTLGTVLRQMAVEDSSDALNQSAVENIERMTTDTANRVADFLYGRDDDILFLAGMTPDEESYRLFQDSAMARVIRKGEWVLAEDGQSWVSADAFVPARTGGQSTNSENNDQDGFHYREPDAFAYDTIPLYDEITFVDLEGNELVKVVSDQSPKINYPLSREKRNVADGENTYVKAEAYFEALQDMEPGEIYVSDVIGAYVGSNYIGMYTPDIVAGAAQARGYDIPYDPAAQSYAGMENPNGQRFEGIVRWATPVAGANGEKIGYVTFALNHDNIMEFVDHLTPMNERYTELPNAYDGNYAFIWDYQCRSICHPRHHSIVGFDPATGEPQVPWLESSIYDAWQASGVEKWTDFVAGWPTFDNQSRLKTPAPILTREGLVGLDGRYLNNAPQCTGWMDLTGDGGSGSFYILWSGLYKLTTAAAIPYYTGQYGPTDANDHSLRGFGFVAIGAGLEDFTGPARETEEKLTTAIGENTRQTFTQLIITTLLIIVFVVLIAIWLASSLTNRITGLIKGISRFRSGERQFRFHARVKDEFGTLADSFDDMADSIVASIKNPLSIVDMNHIIIYMNDQGLDFCRMTLDEIVGTSYDQSSVYPVGTKYHPITALENGVEAETYYVPDSGRYLKGVANYFLSKEGKRIGYIIESTDVTEMVLERNMIEEQRNLFDMIFSASPDVIWYKNLEGLYMAVNPRFASIAGKSTDAFIGKTAQEMMPPELAERFDRRQEETLQAGRPLYSEEHIVFADGHEETLDMVRTPILDANGNIVGLLGFGRDVSSRVSIESELRNTQMELKEAVGVANQANAHKGEFLARMSHEIRTPMNAIIGLAGIVLRKLEHGENGSPTEEIKGHVQQIEASSQHLLGLLNDILDISKIEAGKIELAAEPVEMAPLVTTVESIIRPRCSEKNIAFVTQFDDFMPAAYALDALRLRQVLINLLGNAVKFTPELGRIVFTVRQLERRDGKSLFAFSVRDTGIGIAPEAQEAIFRPFEQEHGKISHRYGGTGLGLSISQRIVELFGGVIRVDSTLGEGSEFSFAVWFDEVENELPQEHIVEDITGLYKGRRALVVDDVEINRMIVMAMLETTGMLIDEAEDGAKAVEAFAASPVGAYDIIFMDVRMPGMDGYEATEAIRALPREDAKGVPIVALTADAFKDDSDRAIRHGMNDHITKPVEMDKLVKTLLAFVKKA